MDMFSTRSGIRPPGRAREEGLLGARLRQDAEANEEQQALQRQINYNARADQRQAESDERERERQEKKAEADAEKRRKEFQKMMEERRAAAQKEQNYHAREIYEAQGRATKTDLEGNVAPKEDDAQYDARKRKETQEQILAEQEKARRERDEREEAEADMVPKPMADTKRKKLDEEFAATESAVRSEVASKYDDQARQSKDSGFMWFDSAEDKANKERFTKRSEEVYTGKADLADDEWDMVSDPEARGKIEALRKAQEEDDAAAKFHMEQSENKRLKALERFAPKRYEEEMRKRRSLMTPEEREADIASGREEFEARRKAHEEGVAGFNSTIQADDEAIAALEKRNAEVMGKGLVPGNAVSVSNPDGTLKHYDAGIFGQLQAAERNREKKRGEWIATDERLKAEGEALRKQGETLQARETELVESRKAKEQADLAEMGQDPMLAEFANETRLDRGLADESMRQIEARHGHDPQAMETAKAALRQRLEQRAAERESDLAQRIEQDGRRIETGMAIKDALDAAEAKARSLELSSGAAGPGGGGSAYASQQAEVNRNAANAEAMRIAQEGGLDENAAKTAVADARLTDWAGAEDKVRVMSNGRVLLNPDPEFILDDDKVRDAVAASNASPSQRKAALERVKSMQYEVAAKAVEGLRKVTAFTNWEKKHGKEYAGDLGITTNVDLVRGFLNDASGYRRLNARSQLIFKESFNQMGRDLLALGGMVHMGAAKVLGADAYRESVIGKVAGLSELNEDEAAAFQGAHEALGTSKAQRLIQGGATSLIPSLVGAGIAASGTRLILRGMASTVARRATQAAATGGLTKTGLDVFGKKLAGIAGKEAGRMGLDGAAVTAMAQTVGGTFPEHYGLYVKRGMSPSDAANKATGTALVSGIGTAIATRAFGYRGVENIFGKTGAELLVKGGKDGLRKVMQDKAYRQLWGQVLAERALDGASEFTEEGIDAVWSGLVEKFTANPDKTWGEIWQDAVDSGFAGLALGVGVPAVKSLGAVADYRDGRKLRGEDLVLAADIAVAREHVDNAPLPEGVDPPSHEAGKAQVMASLRMMEKGVDALNQTELAALGLERKNGKISEKPMPKGADGMTPVRTVMMEDGSPIITDEGLAAIESISPEARRLFKMDEAEQRDQVRLNKTLQETRAAEAKAAGKAKQDAEATPATAVSDPRFDPLVVRLVETHGMDRAAAEQEAAKALPRYAPDEDYAIIATDIAGDQLNLQQDETAGQPPKQATDTSPATDSTVHTQEATAGGTDTDTGPAPGQVEGAEGGETGVEPAEEAEPDDIAETIAELEQAETSPPLSEAEQKEEAERFQRQGKPDSDDNLDPVPTTVAGVLQNEGAKVLREVVESENKQRLANAGIEVEYVPDPGEGTSGVFVDGATGRIKVNLERFGKAFSGVKNKRKAARRVVDEELHHATTIKALSGKHGGDMKRVRAEVSTAYRNFQKTQPKHAERLGKLYSAKSWDSMDDFARGMEVIRMFHQMANGGFTTENVWRTGRENMEGRKAFDALLKERPPVTSAFRKILQAFIDFVNGNKDLSAVKDMVRLSKAADKFLKQSTPKESMARKLGKNMDRADTPVMNFLRENPIKAKTHHDNAKTLFRINIKRAKGDELSEKETQWLSDYNGQPSSKSFGKYGKGLFVRKGGSDPDQVAQQLADEGIIPEGTAEALYHALESERTGKAATTANPEEKTDSRGESPGERLAMETSEIREGAEPVNASMLDVGDVFKVNGEDIEVVDKKDGKLVVQGGRKYGYGTIPMGMEIWMDVASPVIEALKNTGDFWAAAPEGDLSGQSQGDPVYFGDYESYPSRENQEDGSAAFGDLGKAAANVLAGNTRSNREKLSSPPKDEYAQEKLDGRTVIDELAALREFFSEKDEVIDPVWWAQQWREQGKPGGEEHAVIVLGDVFYKANTREFHSTWGEYFHRLMLHNLLFPELAYDVAGMVEGAGDDSKPAIVVTQGTIKGESGEYKAKKEAAKLSSDGKYDPDDEAQRKVYIAELANFQKKIDAYMVANLDAIKDPIENDKYHLPGGITIHDARGENVIEAPDGELMPFDTVIKQKTRSEMREWEMSRGAIEASAPEFDFSDDFLQVRSDNDIDADQDRLAAQGEKQRQRDEIAQRQAEKLGGNADFSKDLFGNVEGFGDDEGILFAAAPEPSAMTPEQSKRYLELAKDPEGNRDELQAMVDAAARAAGYTVGPLWHGSRTKEHFDVFDKERRGKSGYTTATAKLGFFFSPIKRKTDLYGPNKYQVFLKVENPLRLTSSLSNSRNAANVDSIESQMVEGNHDAVMDQQDRKNGNDFFEIAVREPNQIKSADPVTYDADGNVIPLSQRFNPESDNILYSAAPEAKEQDVRYLELAKDPEANREQLQRMVDEAAKADPMPAFRAIEDKNKYSSTLSVNDHGVIIATIGWPGINQLSLSEARGKIFGFISEEMTDAPDGLFWRGTNNKDEIKILDKLISKNHASGEAESGISVSKGLGGSAFAGFKYYYQLSGEEAGTGSDGEPTLMNARATTKMLSISEAEKLSQKQSRWGPGWNKKKMWHLANSRIKSANPITYDESGNVIPLSQRFDSTNDDIRFSPKVRRRDEAYMKAVKAGDMVTAQRLVFEASGFSPVSSDIDRDGAHSPADPESGAPAWGLTENGIYPDDVYSVAGRRYYGTGEDVMDNDAWSKLQRVKGRATRSITVYRAVEKGSKDRGIQAGAWVTIVRAYAVDHGKSALNGDYRIQEKAVKAGEIFTAGDSWLEWGYHPQPELHPIIHRVGRPDSSGKVAPLSERFNPESDSILYASTPSSPTPGDMPWDRAAKSAVSAIAKAARHTPGYNALSVGLAEFYGDSKLTKPVRGIVNYLRKQFVQDGLLPREARALLHEMRIKQALGAEKALDVWRAAEGKPVKFSDLAFPSSWKGDTDMQRRLFWAMNGRLRSDGELDMGPGTPMASLPKELQDLAVKLRAMLDEAAREAVRQGRMHPETYKSMRLEGYMPHYYFEHETMAGKMAGIFRRYKLNQGDIKAQRMTAFRIESLHEKDRNGLPSMLNWTDQKTGRKSYRFKGKQHMDAWFEDYILGEAARTLSGRHGLGTVTARTLQRLEQLPPEQRGYARRVIEETRRKWVKQKPLNIGEHEKAGLITDPVYAITRYVSQMTHDNATANVFNKVADNPNWATVQDLEGLRQIPDRPGFGKLAGMYVIPELYDQITELADIPHTALRIYDKFLTLFKTGKTVYNPGTHGRNVLGNVMFSILAGTTPWTSGKYYTKAHQAIVKGGADLQEMYDEGVLGADFIQAELKENLLSLLPDTALIGDGETLSRFSEAWLAMDKKRKQIADKVNALYTYEDAIYKAAAYLKARDKGLSPADAAAHVRMWFPFYDQVGSSHLVKGLKRGPMPFFSFFRESTRILGNGVKHRPVSLMATMALPEIISQLSAMALGLGDDDEEEIRKDMRGKGKLLFRDTPIFSMLMPFTDSQGRPVQWDLSNVIPFADLLGKKLDYGKKKPLWAELADKMMASPALGVLAAAMGKDTFRDQDLYHEDETVMAKAGKTAKEIYRKLAPPLMPGGTSWDTIAAANKRSTNKTLERRSVPMAATRALAGLDFRTATPDWYRQQEEVRRDMGKKEGSYAGGASAPATAERKKLWGLLVQAIDGKEDMGEIVATLDKLSGYGWDIRANDLSTVLAPRNPTPKNEDAAAVNDRLMREKGRVSFSQHMRIKREYKQITDKAGPIIDRATRMMEAPKPRQALAATTN